MVLGMHSLTPVGLIVLGVLALACVGGWASSGIARLSREFGFLSGALVGVLIALATLPFVNGPLTRLMVLLGIPLVLALLGASLFTEVGQVVADGVHRARLGLLDRLLGALLSVVEALLLCTLALHAFLLFAPHGAVTGQARHDVVARWLLHDRVVRLVERTV